MQTIDKKQVATIQDYAAIVGKSRQTIYNWIKKSKIKTIRYGFQQFVIVAE